MAEMDEEDHADRRSFDGPLVILYQSEPYHSIPNDTVQYISVYRDAFAQQYKPWTAFGT